MTGSVAQGTDSYKISEVRLRFIPDGKDGLVAFASCRVGDLVLNDIAVRRDPDGKWFLTFPRRLSSTGRPYYLHKPINKPMADALEEAILGKLRRLTDGIGESRPRIAE